MMFFFSTNKNKVFSVMLSTGQISWTNDLPDSSTTSSLIVPNYLINFTDNGFISIFDKVNGTILYKKYIFSNFNNLIKKKENEHIIKHLFISSNYLYLITQNGSFLKIDNNNLNNISYKKIAKRFSSNPIIISNNIYILDEKGMIYQIN